MLGVILTTLFCVSYYCHCQQYPSTPLLDGLSLDQVHELLESSTCTNVIHFVSPGNTIDDIATSLTGKLGKTETLPTFIFSSKSWVYDYATEPWWIPWHNRTRCALHVIVKADLKSFTEIPESFSVVNYYFTKNFKEHCQYFLSLGLFQPLNDDGYNGDDTKLRLEYWTEGLVYHFEKNQLAIPFLQNWAILLLSRRQEQKQDNGESSLPTTCKRVHLLQVAQAAAVNFQCARTFICAVPICLKTALNEARHNHGLHKSKTLFPLGEGSSPLSRDFNGWPLVFFEHTGFYVQTEAFQKAMRQRLSWLPFLNPEEVSGAPARVRFAADLALLFNATPWSWDYFYWTEGPMFRPSFGLASALGSPKHVIWYARWVVTSMETIGFVYCEDNNSPSGSTEEQLRADATAFLIPFDIPSWILLLLSVIGLASVYCRKEEEREPRTPGWFPVVALLVAQTWIDRPRRFPLLFTLWAYLATLLGYLFTCFIDAILVVPQEVHTIQDFEELYNQGYRLVVINSSLSTQMYNLLNGNPLLRGTYYMDGLRESIDYVNHSTWIRRDFVDHLLKTPERAFISSMWEIQPQKAALQASFLGQKSCHTGKEGVQDAFDAPTCIQPLSVILCDVLHRTVVTGIHGHWNKLFRSVLKNDIYYDYISTRENSSSMPRSYKLAEELQRARTADSVVALSLRNPQVRATIAWIFLGALACALLLFIAEVGHKSGIVPRAARAFKRLVSWTMFWIRVKLGRAKRDRVIIRVEPAVMVEETSRLALPQKSPT